MQCETFFDASCTFILLAAEVPVIIICLKISLYLNMQARFVACCCLRPYFLWPDSPSGPRPPIVQVARSHSDSSGREISPSQRPLPHNAKHFVPPSGFEPAIQASVRSQTQALDSADTGIWNVLFQKRVYLTTLSPSEVMQRR